jgi:hypothetical protein
VCDGIQEKMAPYSDEQGKDDHNRGTSRSLAGWKKRLFQASRQEGGHPQTKGVKNAQYQQARRQTKGEAAGEKAVGKFTASNTVTGIGAETADDQRGKTQAPRAITSQRQDRCRMCQWKRHRLFEDADDTAG